MARNIPAQLVIAYRGRRSMQYARQDVNVTKADLQKMARAAQASTEHAIQNLNRLGERMFRLGQITTFIFGVGMVRDFFTAGSGFQKSMSGVRAVSRGTEEDFRRLGEQAKDLGKTTVFTATQSAEAMEKLALAGLSVNQIYTIMPDVLNLAAAGELEIAEAATIAVGTLFGFGLAAEELGNAIDVMAYTASNSNQTIRDLGSSFSFVGPVAGAAGVRFTEVNAALAVLANRNLRAERSGTALRRVISILIDDVEEGEKGLAGFGLQLTDSEGRLTSLADAIDQVNESGAKLTDVMGEFQQRAGPAFLALMAAGGDAIRRFEFALERAGGTAQEVATTRLDNLQGRITLLTSAWRGLAVEVFERVEPSLSKVAVSLTNVFRAMGENPQLVQQIASSVKQLVRILVELAAIMVAVRAIRMFATMWANLKAMNFAVTSLSKGFGKLPMIARRFTARLGVMGTAGVAAFGLISFEVTKLILEMAGLNERISRLFERFLESKADMDSYVTSIDMAARHLVRLESMAGRPFGLDMGFSEDDLTALLGLINQFWAASDRGDRGAMRDYLTQIAAMRSELDKTTGYWNRLIKEGQKFADEQPKIWAQALNETETYAEAINRANQLLEKAIKLDKERGEKAAAEAQRLKDIWEDAVSFIDSSLADVSLFRPEKLRDEEEFFRAIMANIGGDMLLMKGFAESAAERIEAFAEAYEKLGKAIPPELAWFVQTLRDFAEAAKGVEEHTENMDDALNELNRSAESMGLVTQQALGEFAANFELIKQAALNSGETVDFAVKSMAENIIFMIDAARKAGQEVPQNLLEVEDAARRFLHMEGFGDFFDQEMERMEDRLAEFGERWQRQWERFGYGITRTVGDAAAQIIVDQESLDAVVEESLKSLAKQAISMLIQWGLQKLIWSKITKGSIIAEHTANLAGYLAEVYASSFASAAAIPIVGWAMAPGVATANLAIASAGAAGAAAVGAGIGAGATGGSALAAEGLIAAGPTNVIAGERGPEMILPLRGPQARRAISELGLSGSDEAPTVLNLNITFTGDNWSDDGVSDELIQRVVEGVNEQITLGRVLTLRKGTL